MLTREVHINFGGEEREVVYMKIRHAKASIVIEQVLENVPFFQDKNCKAFVKCRLFWLRWRSSRRSFNYDGMYLGSFNTNYVIRRKVEVINNFFCL
jgi:hypothetical protein